MKAHKVQALPVPISQPSVSHVIGPPHPDDIQESVFEHPGQVIGPSDQDVNSQMAEDIEGEVDKYEQDWIEELENLEAEYDERILEIKRAWKLKNFDSLPPDSEVYKIV